MGKQAMHNNTSFFTQTAVRTGLLWIPLNGALGLTTPHFAKGVQLWVSLMPLKLERVL